jgi:hypothetical protein
VSVARYGERSPRAEKELEIIRGVVWTVMAGLVLGGYVVAGLAAAGVF